MANQTAVENKNVRGPSFEWWMISNIAIGAGFSAFVALLIPPYVTDVTGNATDAGVVMAIVSLAAVMGPILGGFADRYNAHRLITGLGILGTAVAFLMFSISAESNGLYALDAILMGVSIAAVSAVAPVFIVGAGLPQALQAKRLTTFNLVAPVGQVLGGMMIGAAAAAGWAYNQRFFLAAAVIFICFIIFWFTSKKPAERILRAEPADEAAVKQTQKVGMKGVLFSIFGMYLLILMLSSVAQNGINNQIANILPNVYGIDEATTSGLISLAGLLNILFFFIAGAWMARKGSMPDFTTGNVMRFAGALGMAVLGMVAKSPILIAVAFMQILYQGTPFIRLTQPVLAVRFATIPAGQAIGWVIGASAIGSFLGSVLGGVLADSVGFNAINWMGAIAAGIASLLIFISLWPAERKKRAEEAAAA
ncbi:MAG: MFS transporter [Gammaproteobacteria bacterium]|jgi:predicted MFS family arabinose efflux permease|nr:MFS transporter [Gammaproteobacteria bacterium]